MTIKPGTPRCGAFIKKKNRSCTLRAGFGTDHEGEGTCKWHGGGTIQHRKSLHAEGLRKRAIATYGDRMAFNPY